MTSRLKILPALLILTLILSCKAMNKGSIKTENLPSDLANKNYTILFTELDFEDYLPERTARNHNEQAEKYLKEKFKGKYLYIKPMSINNDIYADKKIYRFAITNKVTHKVTKTSRGATTIGYVSGFYLVDRQTGSEVGLGSSTLAVYMLKGIVDKVNDLF